MCSPSVPEIGNGDGSGAVKCTLNVFSFHFYCRCRCRWRLLRPHVRMQLSWVLSNSHILCVEWMSGSSHKIGLISSDLVQHQFRSMMQLMLETHTYVDRNLCVKKRRQNQPPAPAPFRRAQSLQSEFMCLNNNEINNISKIILSRPLVRGANKPSWSLCARLQSNDIHLF